MVILIVILIVSKKTVKFPGITLFFEESSKPDLKYMVLLVCLFLSILFHR